MWSSVVFPEPDGPVITCSRPRRKTASTPASTGFGPNDLAIPLASAATVSAGAAGAADSGAAAGSATVAVGEPSTAETTIPSSWKRAVARSPIPARARSSSGSRSQPPRPITIVSPAASLRVHSSLTRPSRMRTIRSAIPADSGSWLTTTAVVPASRVSSPISR